MRLCVMGFVFVGLSAAVVAIAQPPSAPPQPVPSTPPTTVLPPAVVPPAVSSAGLPPLPATPMPPAIVIPPATAGQPAIPAAATPHPAAANEPPLSRFQPLAAFPTQTQQAVRTLLLAGNWMTRMNQSNGRFLFGFNPSLWQTDPHDHDLLQARSALATSQLAAFTGDEKQAAIAAQAVLMLLTTTRPDAADPNCRVPLHSSLVCNRVGFAATLAMAIYTLPGADAKLLATADQLTEFLHKNLRSNGSIHYTDGTDDNSIEVDPAGANEYPGLALQALMASHRARPVAWKAEAVRAAVGYYRPIFQSRPHPLLAATLTPAFADLYLQTKHAEAATFVFEMNDQLCRWQIQAGDQRTPHWAGGFRTMANGRLTDAPSGPETGWCVQSLCQARRIAQSCHDDDRIAKFRAASQDAVQYLAELQYVESNTRQFETSFRVKMLIGGFHLSPTDGNIRIDATSTAVSGLLQFLYAALDRI